MDTEAKETETWDEVVLLDHSPLAQYLKDIGHTDGLQFESIAEDSLASELGMSPPTDHKDESSLHSLTSSVLPSTEKNYRKTWWRKWIEMIDDSELIILSDVNSINILSTKFSDTFASPQTAIKQGLLRRYFKEAMICAVLLTCMIGYYFSMSGITLLFICSFLVISYLTGPLLFHILDEIQEERDLNLMLGLFQETINWNKNLDKYVNKMIRIIQEIELIANGYRLSSSNSSTKAISPISRVETNTRNMKAKFLRKLLKKFLESYASFLLSILDNKLSADKDSDESDDDGLSLNDLKNSRNRCRYLRSKILERFHSPEWIEKQQVEEVKSKLQDFAEESRRLSLFLSNTLTRDWLSNHTKSQTTINTKGERGLIDQMTENLAILNSEMKSIKAKITLCRSEFLTISQAAEDDDKTKEMAGHYDTMREDIHDLMSIWDRGKKIADKILLERGRDDHTEQAKNQTTNPTFEVSEEPFVSTAPVAETNHQTNEDLTEKVFEAYTGKQNNDEDDNEEEDSDDSDADSDDDSFRRNRSRSPMPNIGMELAAILMGRAQPDDEPEEKLKQIPVEEENKPIKKRKRKSKMRDARIAERKAREEERRKKQEEIEINQRILKELKSVLVYRKNNRQLSSSASSTSSMSTSLPSSTATSSQPQTK